MFKRSIFIGVIVLATAAVASAGPYSTMANDPANSFDAPIKKTDTKIVLWADAVVDYSPAPGVGANYRDPLTGYGSLGDLYDPARPPATGEIPPLSGATQPFSGDVADTSDEYGFIGYDAPGSITVSFPSGIRDGHGPDFAVFENGADFGTGLFAELAYVEVSTDGTNFARFDSISLNREYVDDSWGSKYATIDETNVYNLAGKHSDGWGTPFNLEELAGHPLVTGQTVDLQDIQYVRLVDIPGIGDGTYVDSSGNAILDAWVTTLSGGYDFRVSQGVGVIHAVPEPGTLMLSLSGLFGVALFAARRRAWQGSSEFPRLPFEAAPLEEGDPASASRSFTIREMIHMKFPQIVDPLLTALGYSGIFR